MTGNVWEWTTDWYSPAHAAEEPKACCVPRNPRGGAKGQPRSRGSRTSAFRAK